MAEPPGPITLLIVALLKKEPELRRLTGALLRDERFMVRMGVAVVYEELAIVRPAESALAIPALRPLLTDPVGFCRANQKIPCAAGGGILPPRRRKDDGARMMRKDGG
jgi:hypothetical protein